MNEGGRGEQIGTPWIATMIILLVLLVLGVFLYLQMSLPPREDEQENSTTAARVSVCECNDIRVPLSVSHAWEHLPVHE